MKEQRTVLLLVGSAKRPRSTSESLGSYLLERLREKGFDTETQLLPQMLQSEESRAALFEATDRADVCILACPLYVDSLPSLVVRALELLAQHRQAQAELREQRLLALVNCGFPEAHHTATALAICRRFAQETGYDWAGGLALGAGEIINGRPLPEMGRMVRKVTRSLDLTADALGEGHPVPEEAVNLMAQPLVPRWLYVWLGHLNWKRQAKKHGVQRHLRDRPYEF